MSKINTQHEEWLKLARRITRLEDALKIIYTWAMYQAEYATTWADADKSFRDIAIKAEEALNVSNRK